MFKFCLDFYIIYVGHSKLTIIQIQSKN